MVKFALWTGFNAEILKTEMNMYFKIKYKEGKNLATFKDQT